MKKLMFILLSNVFLFGVNYLKAQEEDCPVCGWYADGVKVEKIDCYAWDKLQLVLPYNAGMEGYDFINVTVHLEEGNHLKEGVKSVPGSGLKTLLKGNYIVYTVFSKEYGDGTMMKGGFGSNSPLGERECTISRDILPKKGKAGIKGQNLTCWVRGVTITGYEEKYNPGRRTVEKKPVYSKTDLSRLYTVLFVNSVNADFSQPCAFPGKKVDINNLGGGSSSSNDNTKTDNSYKKAGTANVKSDRADGAYELKDESGQVQQTGTYKNQKKQGLWKSYANGKVYLEENYVDDVKTGVETKYNDNGGIEYKMEFKNGEQNGSTQIFENSKLKSNNMYLNGKKNGKCTDYYSEGGKYSEENYVNGKLDGIKNQYSNNGQISSSTTYKDDQMNGPYKSYNEGKLEEEGNYKNGMQDGVWKKRNKAGMVTETKTYKEGVPQE